MGWLRRLLWMKVFGASGKSSWCRLNYQSVLDLERMFLAAKELDVLLPKLLFIRYELKGRNVRKAVASAMHFAPYCSVDLHEIRWHTMMLINGKDAIASNSHTPINNIVQNRHCYINSLSDTPLNLRKFCHCKVNHCHIMLKKNLMNFLIAVALNMFFRALCDDRKHE